MRCSMWSTDGISCSGRRKTSTAKPRLGLAHDTTGGLQMRFSIYSGLVLVGYSALDYGDPPMGVAFGQFEPADGYAAIQNQCSTNHHDQTVLDLSVQTEAGLVIPCAGLAILDYSEELAPPCIEVNIFDIPHPLYGELFPQHVTLYERQLS